MACLKPIGPNTSNATMSGSQIAGHDGGWKAATDKAAGRGIGGLPGRLLPDPFGPPTRVVPLDPYFGPPTRVVPLDPYFGPPTRVVPLLDPHVPGMPPCAPGPAVPGPVINPGGPIIGATSPCEPCPSAPIPVINPGGPIIGATSPCQPAPLPTGTVDPRLLKM